MNDWTTETRGHIWKKEPSGEPELFEADFQDGPIHSGPLCVNCYYCFCIHCQDLPSEDCEAAENTGPVKPGAQCLQGGG